MIENALLNWLDKIYGFIVKVGSNLQSFFLLYMRLTWGHQFFLAGLAKLQDINGTAQVFAKLQIVAPLFHAYEVGILEFVGGILLILGFASRLIAIPLILLLLTALSTAHSEALSNLSFLKDPHILVAQAPYPYLITALLVLTFGPGRVSIDAWIKRWMSKLPRY